MVHSSVEFIEKFVSVRRDEHFRGILLDDPMFEMVQELDGDRVIGRYPRQYGKTTALMGYVLYRMIAKRGVHISYAPANPMQGIQFLQGLANAYRRLPKSMNSVGGIEHPDYFRIGDSIVTLKRGRSDFGAGSSEGADWVVYDDWARDKMPFVTPNEKTAIIGTFSLDSEVGKIWKDGLDGWKPIPSLAEQWKVNTVLSLCNPLFSQGY